MTRSDFGVFEVMGGGIDRNGLEILDREECLRLVASATIGRIGITSGALPIIVPVNFRLVDGQIVFRTGVGTKLEAATRGAVVAFEFDSVDPFSHTGWSVSVTGVAREITDQMEIDRMDRANIPRWAPAGGGRLVAVSAEIVSGRRIGLGAQRSRAAAPPAASAVEAATGRTCG